MSSSTSDLLHTSGSYSRRGVDDETPEGYHKVVEGYAAVLFPPADLPQAKPTGKEDKKKAGGDAHEVDPLAVFYNPAQVVNRDLSTCAIETFSRIRKTEKPRKGGTGDEGITILEALSATGLRAIRYWKEISGVKHIIANDIDADAVKCIDENCNYNGIGPEAIIRNHDDAVVLMQRLGIDPYTTGGRKLVWQNEDGSVSDAALLQQTKVDVVDLDPYGTVTPFLDSSMRCAKEGALMLITCTDSNILCGTYPEKCFGNYNGIAIRNDACHEMACRLVLASIERAANKHSKYIEPLLSLHIDFYVRVFVRVYTQPAAVKRSCMKLGHLFQCSRCPAHFTRPVATAKPVRTTEEKKRDREGKKKKDGKPAEDGAPAPEVAAADETESKQPSPPETFPVVPPYSENLIVKATVLDSENSCCGVCGGRMRLGGPIYCAPTQNRYFLKQLMEVIDEKHEAGHLTATDRIRGLVRVASEELPDVPLFYSIPQIGSLCRVSIPPTPIFLHALAQLGYRFSQVHCDKSGLKTDAPAKVLVQVMLAYRKFIDRDPDEETEKAINKNDMSLDAALTLRVEALEIPKLSFTYNEAYDWRSSTTGITKFIPNAPGWGPKARHVGIKDEK